MAKTRIMILGANGMLGHVLFKHLHNNPAYSLFGTVRSTQNIEKFFTQAQISQIIGNVCADNFDSFIPAFATAQPNVVINCIGIIKQHSAAKYYEKSICINSLLPHRLATLASIANARLIHISTDCVFTGKSGNYDEDSPSDANDLYGKSKYLGEIDYPHTLTIRTSIIGHSLDSNLSLIDWFLSQNGEVDGYTNAIYSGLPTYELARIIDQYVIPNHNLHGLYHVAVNKISKFELLKMVAKQYNKQIHIIPSDKLIVDRSLNSSKFRHETKYTPPEWSKLISNMHQWFINNDCYDHKRVTN